VISELVAQALEGRPRAVAQLISRVESGSPDLPEIAALLAPHTGRAQVVGLTGSPGVGKSTTTSALVTALRAEGKRVGVLAIDPSSPFSGGALLGDRSMATRGHLGGLAWATPQALRVLDAAGCDVVLVETVGVGQSEIDVVSMADTTLVLLAPGMGDGVQAAKAGILEIADVFVVNKADRDGAAQTVRDLRYMMSLGSRHDAWTPPIHKTVAARGEGIDAVAKAIEEHRTWLAASGEGARRRRRRAEAEIEAIALEKVRVRISGLGADADRVVTGDLDPYAAADEALRRTMEP
jgi:LAO/AO transport system kinase